MTTKVMIVSTLVALVSASALQAQQPPSAPPAQPAAPPADSAALYAKSCAACHGARGTPSAAMARSTIDFASAEAMAAVTDSALRLAITDGKGRAMPAYKARLTAEQITALVGYIRTFSKH
jgi:mono/diheme cytochrome c family protein